MNNKKNITFQIKSQFSFFLFKCYIYLKLEDNYMKNHAIIDEKFDEIKKALLNCFEECEVTNRNIEIEVEFKQEDDAERFKTNICYPKNLYGEERPIGSISSLSPIGDAHCLSPFGYVFNFKVNDQDRLIKMLNELNILRDFAELTGYL